MEEEIVPAYVCQSLTAEETRNEPCWFAVLSDDTRVYSKVGQRSWLQLKSWLKENPSLFIKALYFQFRDNTIEVGYGPYEGYFFSHGVNCWYGTGVSQQTFIGGIVKEGILYRKKYILPEMVLDENGHDNFPANTPEVQKGLILRDKQKEV